ncbi:MAG TPA: L-histidine N(alpha)-methyltransferase [Rubricoccaceae bacterium]|nr:L-histidine N(alpha)-methyltransferase [Rubricoccaceae bacterium]
MRNPALLREARAGLNASPKTIPSKYFYDEVGSALFERITTLEAYYPTRTELRILRDHLSDIAATIGQAAALIEFGSGASLKTRLLLDALPDLAAYVPVDIAEEALAAAAEQLRGAYPNLPILPVVADFTGPFSLPPLPERARRRAAFFPGSTIGNFDPEAATALLHRIADLVGPTGGLLLGLDRKKDRTVLEAAYNDPEDVTAAFNKNLLTRLNREAGADFDLDAFDHRAFYNAEAGRIEMHLASLRAQTVHLDGQPVSFQEGETIHTENSYKYGPGEMEALAEKADLRLVRAWTDARAWFAVHYYEHARQDGGPPAQRSLTHGQDPQ